MFCTYILYILYIEILAPLQHVAIWRQLSSLFDSKSCCHDSAFNSFAITHWGVIPLDHAQLPSSRGEIQQTSKSAYTFIISPLIDELMY